MLERGEIQKSFRHDGVLIIIFNALAFDLLVVGYGQHEDGTEIKELLSAMTLASFFEAALVVLFAFTSYVVIAKEPLIWILSRLYFCVIFLRVVCYPFWRAGYSEQLSKDALKIARSDWKAFVAYQLNDHPEGPNWKSHQHLAVATFFLFLLSLLAPLFEFQSIGYRLLPGILDKLGLTTSLHWVAGLVLIIAICYICSNGMMAFAGDHRKKFQVYHTRSVNQEFIEALDAAISSHQKAKETLQMLKVDEPAWVRANQEDVQAFEDLVLLLDEVRSRVAESMETNHGKLVQEMFGKKDPP